MNYTISFQERAKLGLEQLSKLSPVTLTMASGKDSNAENKKHHNEK